MSAAGEEVAQLVLGGHRGGAGEPGGDEGAGRVRVPHDLFQVPARQEAVAERTAERVAGPQSVDDLDGRGRYLGDPAVAVHGEYALVALLHDGQFHTGVKERLR